MAALDVSTNVMVSPAVQLAITFSVALDCGLPEVLLPATSVVVAKVALLDPACTTEIVMVDASLWSTLILQLCMPVLLIVYW